MNISSSLFKDVQNSNPVSACLFCADPFAIEYEGRLYVYGTNDQQQFIENGCTGNNTYEKINSIVCFSTDDMINWEYHGYIDVKKAAPWILSSWAPCIIYRKEKTENGEEKTKFYLYFSNSGCGVGVLTSESPLGPWTSPLDHPLLNYDMDGLENVPNPFDPGVCIDDDGNGYLVFGGGVAPGGDEVFPGSSCIVRLGKDFISVQKPFIQIQAPYFFEASDVYYMNGTFVYSYNTNWMERKFWNFPENEPSPCCMSYMTTKTPLDGSSWKYQGHYFKNPGEMGFDYSNNHVCITKFKGRHYIFYHTLLLQSKKDITGGFRSICADYIDVDEKNARISMAAATRKGVQADGNVCPYAGISGTLQYTSAGIDFSCENRSENPVAFNVEDGAWFVVKNVDFESGCREFSAEVKGLGKVLLYADNISETPLASFECNSTSYCNVKTAFKLSGQHDIFFVIPHGKVYLKNWQCTR